MLSRLFTTVALFAFQAVSSPLHGQREDASPAPLEGRADTCQVVQPPDHVQNLEPQGSMVDGKMQYVDTWVVTWKNIQLPGKSCKKKMVVNDKWPPPRVVVNEGTIVRITLKNSLDDGKDVSLHAHGLLQKNNMWMDGPTSVTQVGVPVGKKFEYVWDTMGEPGTWWIHSHVPGQYPMGLRMPFIIKNSASERQQFPLWEPSIDSEITLSDWFHKEWSSVESIYHSSTCGSGVEVPPDTMIINDNAKSIYDFSSFSKLRGRLRLINTSAFASFYVYVRSTHDSEPKVRFQVMETDGVLMDGSGIYEVLEIAPGQRLSVLVDYDGNNLARDPRRYPLVVAMNPHLYRKTQVAAMGKAPSTNQYRDCLPSAADVAAGLPAGTPLTSYNMDQLKKFITVGTAWITLGDKNKPFDGTELIPQRPSMVTADDEYRICFPWLAGRGQCATTSAPMSTNYADFDDMLLKPKVAQSGAVIPPLEARYLVEAWWDNDSSSVHYGQGSLRVLVNANRNQVDNANGYNRYVPEAVPALRNIELGNRPSVTSWPASTNTIHILPGVESFWLVLYDFVGTHPFHLHGHTFQVIYRERQQAETGSTRSERLKRLWDNPSFFTTPQAGQPGWAADMNNPPRRDTIQIYKESLTVLKVTADNPGAWFFHCHNDFHAETGMAAQIIENQPAVRTILSGLDSTKTTQYKKAVGLLPMDT